MWDLYDDDDSFEKMAKAKVSTTTTLNTYTASCQAVLGCVMCIPDDQEISRGPRENRNLKIVGDVQPNISRLEAVF